MAAAKRAQSSAVAAYLDDRVCGSTVRQARRAAAAREANAALSPERRAVQQFDRLPTVTRMSMQRRSLFHPDKTGTKCRAAANHTATHNNTGGDLSALTDWSHSFPRIRKREISLEVMLLLHAFADATGGHVSHRLTTFSHQYILQATTRPMTHLYRPTLVFLVLQDINKLRDTAERASAHFDEWKHRRDAEMRQARAQAAAATAAADSHYRDLLEAASQQNEIAVRSLRVLEHWKLRAVDGMTVCLNCALSDLKQRSCDTSTLHRSSSGSKPSCATERQSLRHAPWCGR